MASKSSLNKFDISDLSPTKSLYLEAFCFSFHYVTRYFTRHYLDFITNEITFYPYFITFYSNYYLYFDTFDV